MKDGAVEQCDTPDRIVLDPATPYVAKFIEDIEAARVVHAGAICEPMEADTPTGDPVSAKATIHSLARRLVSDDRPIIPVADASGALVGGLNRSAALNILLGSDE